jgi:hypothetical protein
MAARLFSLHSARWGRLLALLLAGALLVQSGPVPVLVQQIGLMQARHTCHHCDRGFCPRTPDAACACASTASTTADADRPLLRSCDTTPAESSALPTAPKWGPNEKPDVPLPRTFSTEHVRQSRTLAPQQFGDDVFRPPRATSSVHPS